MTSKIEVPRELLQDLISYADKGKVAEPYMADQLRELLSAPEAQRQDAQQMASMPVERCYDVRAKMIIAFNEAKKAGGDLDDWLDAAYKSALRYSPAMQSTVVGEAERLNGMLDAASELLRTKQRVNRELRSELERIKTINDNNFNLLLDQIFAAPLSPDHSGGGAGMVLTDDQILEAMREHIYAADGGYVFDTAKDDVIAAGRALLDKVKELNQ